jgi:twitching motility protein PilT
MNPEDRLFGEIAIKLGLVTRQGLGLHVKAIRARPGQIAAILLQAGELTEAQIATIQGHFDRIVRQRRAVRAGADPGAAAPDAPRRHRVAPPPQPQTATRPSLSPSPPSLSEPALSNSSQAAPFLDQVLAQAVRLGGSDVHVHAGAPLLVRVAGRLEPIAGPTPVPPSDTEKMVAQLLTPQRWQRLASDGQVDFAYAIAGVGRFRVNAFRQQRGMDIVFRVIAEPRKSLEQLGLPATLTRLLDFRTGLVLCTGPTGSGKSTTLAALLDVVIAQRKEHVITLEDPIEHVLVTQKAWVNQREVESHTESYARALRAALREDPDVIAITELRDRESISLALTAAETGHLVLATVNTNSAGQTINRIVNSFPGEEQGHVRSILSESLRAVISQRLVPTADGKGRVPAVEVLIGTTAVANTIRDNKTFQLPSLMQTGLSVGMVTLDDSLFRLVQAGTIDKSEAARLATMKERFK